MTGCEPCGSKRTPSKLDPPPALVSRWMANSSEKERLLHVVDGSLERPVNRSTSASAKAPSQPRPVAWPTDWPLSSIQLSIDVDRFAAGVGDKGRRRRRVHSNGREGRRPRRAGEDGDGPIVVDAAAATMGRASRGRGVHPRPRPLECRSQAASERTVEALRSRGTTTRTVQRASASQVEQSAARGDGEAGRRADRRTRRGLSVHGFDVPDRGRPSASILTLRLKATAEGLLTDG